MRLKTKVAVHSWLSSASDQSLAMALRTGRRMKYAAIRMKTNANDRRVAFSSCRSILVAALKMLPNHPPLFPFIDVSSLCLSRFRSSDSTREASLEPGRECERRAIGGYYRTRSHGELDRGRL